MTAFWKKKKEEDKKIVKQETINVSDVKKEKLEKKEKVAKKSKKVTKKSKKKTGLVVPGEKADLINKVLIKPMISEAVMNAQEMGKYTFKVVKSASKNQISLAIEALYKVSVEKVNVINYKPQEKIFRGKKGKTKSYKKAIVTLKSGDKIKLFS